MTNFGQLDEQLDAYDIAFTFKGKEYQITPSVQEVLTFHRELGKEQTRLAENNQFDDGLGVWARVAPLLGSKFTRSTGKFTGGILAELEKAGASFSQMERLVSAVHLKYTQSDDLAKAYFATGNLKKAWEKMSNADQPSPETPKDAGETNGDA